MVLRSGRYALFNGVVEYSSETQASRAEYSISNLVSYMSNYQAMIAAALQVRNINT